MSSETFVHSLAVVEPGAQLGVGARIGPFCFVGAETTIGDRVELISHVSVLGATTIGAGTRVWPNAVLGGEAQSKHRSRERVTLEIGRDCTIREFVTMHVGTDNHGGRTVVGDNGFFMANAHIAHDCIVGNNATFANGATLGGHTEIGHNVGIGGLTATHQFVKVGDGAFLTGCSAVTGNVIPYGVARGNLATLRGLNVVGMRRSGMPKSEIHVVRRAYKTIFDRARPVSENLETARREFAASPAAMSVVDFMLQRGKRHFLVPPLAGGDDDDDAEL
ncbi:MAG: acyl-ACP--UDP-N-acetylglucosamine O-acyltransferase [Rhizobiaceae bacterium]